MNRNASCLTRRPTRPDPAWPAVPAWVRLHALGLVLVWASFANSAEPETASAQGELRNLNANRGDIPFRAKLEGIAFTDQPGPGAPSFPKDMIAPLYSSVRFHGKTLGIALAKKTAESPTHERLHLDADGDGAIADSETFNLETQVRPYQGGEQLIVGNPIDLNLGDKDHPSPISFEYRDYPKEPLKARLLFFDFLHAQIKVGNDTFLLAFMDQDHNGRYGDAADQWLQTKDPAWGAQPQSEYALNAVNEGRFADGFRYAVSVDAAHKVQLTRVAAASAWPEDLAKQRGRIEQSWVERFDKERDQFVKDHQLDVSRPRTDEPVKWRYVGFEEAQAMAKASGKPLFVDALAFWCVWCYRLDYYTYVDKEVARVLNEKFIPVKIVHEQNPDSYVQVIKRIDAKGIPAMGIWSAQGERIHTISGWKKPEDFLADLQQALAKAGGN